MRETGILITGANGEMGHGLIDRLAGEGLEDLIALDIKPIDTGIQKQCRASISGDILDERLLERLQSEYEIHTVYHLAALLSTRAEFTPEAAHRVNVGGTMKLLKLAIEQAHWHGRSVKFMFPSSIAVYGLPGRAVKEQSGKVKETEWNFPSTIYGCNKLYCEHLGRYYANHYRQLAADSSGRGIDFRCIRFPGLISAVTLPSGGTTDYAPEMIHAAASGKRYGCFVSRDTCLPFIIMPDAINALLQLEVAPQENLRQSEYNISSFSMTAGEIHQLILNEWPQAQIGFKPDGKRQAIVDSWPAEVDDSAARQDWGWAPRYDKRAAFKKYLIPGIRSRYRS